MNFMETIGNWFKKKNEEAFDDENKIRGFVKESGFAFLDGVCFGALCYGLVLTVAGVFIIIKQLIDKVSKK